MVPMFSYISLFTTKSTLAFTCLSFNLERLLPGELFLKERLATAEIAQRGYRARIDMAVRCHAILPCASSPRSAPFLSKTDQAPGMRLNPRCNDQLRVSLIKPLAPRKALLLSLRPGLSQGFVKNMTRDKRSRGNCSVNGGLSITRCVNYSPGPKATFGTENSKGSISELELARNRTSLEKRTSYNGIFLILLLNLGIFVGDHWLGLTGLRQLYLYHDMPQWYQFITSTFCHLSWSHLSSNLFFLYIFGKLVEEEGGGFAVWLSYLITGVGANLVSWLILPRTVVSAGASGAVFGLFAISVLVKLSFDWRKILEVLILGQFVVEKVMEAAHASAQLGGRVYNSSMNINHIAHLSGALVGVALIWILRRLPSGETRETERK